MLVFLSAFMPVPDAALWISRRRSLVQLGSTLKGHMPMRAAPRRASKHTSHRRRAGERVSLGRATRYARTCVLT